MNKSKYCTNTLNIPSQVGWSGKPQLIVHYEMDTSSYSKMWELGQRQRFSCNALHTATATYSNTVWCVW